LARPVRLSLVLVVVLAGVPVAAAPTSYTAPDELWRKAVAIVGNNDTWTPGTTALTGQETDGQGRTRSSWDVTIRSSRGPDGSPVQEILKYIENGKDVTAQKKGSAAPRSGGGQRGAGPFSWNPSDPRQTPFHPSAQDRVSVRRLDTEVMKDGRLCAAYAFAQQLGGAYRAVGTAWIDAGSGAPVALEATFDPLPPFVSSAGVEVDFESGAGGAWLVSRLKAVGEATILFIRRSFAMELDLRDHWKLPPERGAK
jgi:hypothetical protein